MERNRIVFLAFFWGLALFGCTKKEPEIIKPEITHDKVEVTSTSASFTWTVDWLGKRISVVEVSENEDMSDSQFYGSEENVNNDAFSATANDLKPDTKYYYRFWVWNKNYVDNKFVFEKKDFSTLSDSPTENGVLSGLFSVSATQKVYFSRGNLQYKASTDTWRFALNQYDLIGATNSNISQTYNDWIDLYGWGTSGWNNGNTYYHPWDSEHSFSDYSFGKQYGPVGAFDLVGLYSNSDWGCYNWITNGGNTINAWRTLTIDEWLYVFNTRNTLSGIRYAKAQVNGCNGIILLPDDWETSTFPLNNENTDDSSLNSNVISSAQWIILEDAGAVFLPAAGIRQENKEIKNVNAIGQYWSSSCYGSGDYESLAYCMTISESRVSHSDAGRDDGLSVRLVKDYQP